MMHTVWERRIIRHQWHQIILSAITTFKLISRLLKTRNSSKEIRMKMTPSGVFLEYQAMIKGQNIGNSEGEA
jgi:hypothetical protein